MSMPDETRAARPALSLSRSLSEYGWVPHTKRQFGLTDVWARFRSMPKLTKLNCPLTHTHTYRTQWHLFIANCECRQKTVMCCFWHLCVPRILEWYNARFHSGWYFSLFLNFNVFALVRPFVCRPACPSIFSLRTYVCRLVILADNQILTKLDSLVFGQRFRCPSPRARRAHLGYSQRRITYSNYNEMEAKSSAIAIF